MKRSHYLLVIVLVFYISESQISTTKIEGKKQEDSFEPYDSLANHLGKRPHMYVGQDLYLIGKPEDMRKYGYRDFYIDYTENTTLSSSNVYECCDSYNSKYEAMAGKYYHVRSVHKSPDKYNDNIFFLELEEKESKDKLYYKYNSGSKYDFPFLVVGFYERAKKHLVNNSFVFADKVLEKSTDIKTGELVNNKPNQVWECIDLTIEEKYYKLALIIRNSLGETTIISYETAAGYNKEGKSYTLNEAKTYEKKYGRKNWLLILQNRIAIGFTKEMTLLSWGKPKKINRSSYGDQWVYSSQYLYFKDGVLKSFN